jgi:hypothetical protein
MNKLHILSEDEIDYELGSFADGTGRLFYWNNRVFRKVLDEGAWNIYRVLLESKIYPELLSNGLVETWIRRM